jgi:HTH-type transcriptional regulator, transcriptional repressor of NAD biosynthesis genes
MIKKRGIVIGKFYPPHLGHKFLIDNAEAGCDQLTILVCDSPKYKVPASLRARWLKMIHPNCKVVIIEDIGQDDDSKAWADYTLEFLGYKPDVVYSSEQYGDAYAKYMNCDHMMIDNHRINVNISATQIRNDLMGNWEYLHPIVQAHYAIRVCVIGAESTGTTTLTKALAKHYNTNWVPEYGRFYSEAKLYQNIWSSEEFEFIANQQNTIEDQLALGCNKVLICDTNAMATSVWHNRYMHYYSDAVNDYSLNRKYDLYILTGDEIPFVQDGLRDGEDIRHEMHETFLNKLRGMNNNYIHVTGDVRTRLESSIEFIDILVNGFKF